MPDPDLTRASGSVGTVETHYLDLPEPVEDPGEELVLLQPLRAGRPPRWQSR